MVGLRILAKVHAQPGFTRAQRHTGEAEGGIDVPIRVENVLDQTGRPPGRDAVKIRTNHSAHAPQAMADHALLRKDACPPGRIRLRLGEGGHPLGDERIKPGVLGRQRGGQLRRAGAEIGRQGGEGRGQIAVAQQ